MILSASGGILKPIAIGLGHLMDWIYIFLGNVFHVHNVALTIIVLTIIIYIILMPLTYQQQKFSKMSQVMNPELQAIQKKYRGKRDQESVNAMNAETQALYAKYGVRPSGSCITMVIQLLILFPLYRVIYNVPAYIGSVRSAFDNLVTGIMATDGYTTTFSKFFKEIGSTYVYRGVKLNFDGSKSDAANSIIDVVYKCTADNWATLTSYFPNLSDVITNTQQQVNAFNNFLGVSIVYSPRNLIGVGFHEHHPLFIIVGILIAVFAAGFQFLNIRLMPQPATGSNDAMGRQMKTMNYLMPIYSFILVFFLPVGVGVYWIAGAVIRSLQQLFFNRRFDKMDLKKMVEENQKKAEAKNKEKIEKKGVSGQKIQNAASINTKKMNSGQQYRADSMAARANVMNQANKAAKKGQTAEAEEAVETVAEAITFKKNSLTAKANLVQEFNEKNTRKSGSHKNQGKSLKGQAANVQEEVSSEQGETAKDTSNGQKNSGSKKNSSKKKKSKK